MGPSCSDSSSYGSSGNDIDNELMSMIIILHYNKLHYTHLFIQHFR